MKLKHMIAFLLCALLLCSIVPVSAFAEGDIPGKDEPAPSQEIVLEVGEPATVQYLEHVRIRARASGVPEGYYLGIFIDGKIVYRGSNSYFVEYRYLMDKYPQPQPTDVTDAPMFFGRFFPLSPAQTARKDFTYTVTIVDADGNPLLGTDGNPISKDNQVTVKKAFWTTIINYWFLMVGIMRWADVGVK